MLSNVLRAAGAMLVLAFVGASAGHASPPPTTLTVTLDGTAGPVLSGTDPLGLNGQSATVALMIDEGSSPVKHTTKSATYKVPAGAVTITFNGTQYQTSSPSKMTIKLGASADTLTLAAAVMKDGITVTVVDTTVLAAGSWTKSALKHPAPFTPSPQDFTEPASKIKYTLFGSSTVLGVTGTASNSDALDPRLPDDEVGSE